MNIKKDKSEFVTISIPKQLAEKLTKRIEGTSFNSLSSYVTYVMSEVLSEIDEDTQEAFTKEDEERIKQRLRSLGYLDWEYVTIYSHFFATAEGLCLLEPMKLDENINYIVSGLERSGTSMMMQVLNAVDVPVAFDDLRLPDENNPKGYFELEGGKIINKLMNGTFPLQKYQGVFIKITAFGLLYLPYGEYKIIYMERNLEEIFDSMQKMSPIIDLNLEKTKESFMKLNEKVKHEIQKRPDVNVLFLNYNEIIFSPKKNMERICRFLSIPKNYSKKMVNTIDNGLYRQRKKIR